MTPYATTGDISLGAKDVDFFLIHLNANTKVSVVSSPLSADFVPQTYLALFAPDRSLLKSNVGAGDDGTSLVNYRVAMSGDYYIGVTGVDSATGIADEGFTGAHDQSGLYQLTVSVSPTV